jgi:hypothetical protein
MSICAVSIEYWWSTVMIGRNFVISWIIICPLFILVFIEINFMMY